MGSTSLWSQRKIVTLKENYVGILQYIINDFAINFKWMDLHYACVGGEVNVLVYSSSLAGIWMNF